MLFAGARASNLTATQSNIRSRLPGPDEVFYEGYLQRKTVSFGTGLGMWQRQFCILQHGQLLFHGTWSSLSDSCPPLFSLKLDSTVNLVLVGESQLNLESPAFPTTVMVSFTGGGLERQIWKAMLQLELDKTERQIILPAPVRSRYFEGYLFKTPPVPKRWEERWFELNGRGELAYFSQFGGEVRGKIDLETCKIVPNQTEAVGICTPYCFQIHAFEQVMVQGKFTGEFKPRVYNLCAPTQLEYLNWLKALKVWVGVKRPDPFLGGTEREGEEEGLL
ncbi:hypothetical protein BASA81_001769 [Batrachochytrium salamandrivorans]|nr:hypothetical protein BASA81_001769 [Batrachochytrium salamandrivorans]